MSNELAAPAGLPLRLSLPAQSTLGLVVDLRRNRCWVPDFDGEVRFYEVANCRLRAICISDVEPPQARSWSGLEVDDSAYERVEEPTAQREPRTPDDDSLESLGSADEEEVDLPS